MDLRKNTVFLKIKFIGFIFLFLVLLIVSGCVKKGVYVEFETKDIQAEETDTKESNLKTGYISNDSNSGVGKPYYIDGVQYVPENQPRNYTQRGIASWYGKKFHGRKTASGEIYNMYAMTAAHKTLPLQTWVKVLNLRNKKEIVVRINDRGPFVRGRVIDLTFTGAKKLGMVKQGTAPVKVIVLGKLKNSKARKKEYVPVDLYTGNFSIQVGAFKVKSNAENLKYRLSRVYKDVHITTHKDYRGTFYRVRVGKYSSLKKALMLEKKLSLNGHRSVFLLAE